MMSNDPNELAKTLGALGSRYLEEYTRGLQRCGEMLNDLASRPPDDADGLQQGLEMQQRYARFVVEESPRVIERLTEASVSYYAALANTGMQLMNSYVDQVLKPDNGATGRRDRGSTSSSPLVFHGERGGQASNAFMVSNSQDRAIDVTFAIDELASADGKTRFEPQAHFTPERCKVPPRSQQVVQCSLTLTSDFAAGQVHQGHIQVVGFPEMAMPIRVEVEEGETDAGNERPAVAKKKAPAKRKASAAKHKPAGGRRSG